MVCAGHHPALVRSGASLRTTVNNRTDACLCMLTSSVSPLPNESDIYNVPALPTVYDSAIV